MKNLLVYINPEKKFLDYHDLLSRVQIDNCYSLGWKKEDILLVTNFDYEYNGVKATVVADDNYCTNRHRSTKTTTLPLLINIGLIDELCWVHDFDAYENNPIFEADLGMDLYHMALTDYGWKTRWGLGSFFTRPSAVDILDRLRENVYARSEWDKSVSSEDESIFCRMWNVNACDVRSRCKKINITYNFAIKHLEEVYKIAEKPLKVLHFKPDKWRLADFMYGKALGFPMMSDRLIDVFAHHGIH